MTTPKIYIPEIDIIQFIKELIVSNLVNIHYFGPELNNIAGYIDEEITDKNKNTTFLIFHFKDDQIIYKSYGEDAIFQLIYNKLSSKTIAQVILGDKDTEIFIN